LCCIRAGSRSLRAPFENVPFARWQHFPGDARQTVDNIPFSGIQEDTEWSDGSRVGNQLTGAAAGVGIAAEDRHGRCASAGGREGAGGNCMGSS
jgi:hypothetical protein